MSDQPNNPANNPSEKRLSEISHLFLSSVRDRQTDGAPRPERKPPTGTAAKKQMTIDLTPEEFAHVFGEKDAIAPLTSAPSTVGEKAAAPDQEPRVAPIAAILGTHLNGKLFDRLKEYAGHLC